LFQALEGLDARLLGVPKRTRQVVIGLTIATMVLVSIPHVPRQYIDYSRIPVLNRLHQNETYGTDTISDVYGSKVILNDIWDMYTKKKLDQTPLEAATWSKEASAPYPPVVRLCEAALYVLGAWTGIGLYGMILILACVFLGLSLLYFLNTRWYLFPVLYLNFFYFGYRFVYVQDGTYLVMLVVIMTALFLARARLAASHALMAVATTMKLTPLFYAKNILRMNRWIAVLFIAILLAGLVLPYFIWDNYAYIYRFGAETRRVRWYDTAGAMMLVLPFASVIWYVEMRLGMDVEERIGWDLVPVAMFFAISLNSARHLLIVLLVPDKRGARNIAAAIGLALHSLFPQVILLGSVVYISTALLAVSLVYHLERIGWATVVDDLRHPARTARLMLARD
jgi:hypothetical protein